MNSLPTSQEYRQRIGLLVDPEHKIEGIDPIPQERQSGSWLSALWTKIVAWMA